MNESSEARRCRLLKKHQQAKQAVESETTEQRELRLSNKRKKKRNKLFIMNKMNRDKIG